MPQTVTLEPEEWQQVMNALIQANPLLMKLANQLREQGPAPNTSTEKHPSGNSKEAHP